MRSLDHQCSTQFGGYGGDLLCLISNTPKTRNSEELKSKGKPLSSTLGAHHPPSTHRRKTSRSRYIQFVIKPKPKPKHRRKGGVFGAFGGAFYGSLVVPLVAIFPSLVVIL